MVPAEGSRQPQAGGIADPGNPLVLDGDVIDAADHDPLAIGKL